MAFFLCLLLFLGFRVWILVFTVILIVAIPGFSLVLIDTSDAVCVLWFIDRYHILFLCCSLLINSSLPPAQSYQARRWLGDAH